jgi:RHS repeat-associated protein
MTTSSFTGHLRHNPSNLELALFRAYDSGSGRWISEDPVGLFDGPNLHRYAANDPIAKRDRLGLETESCAGMGPELQRCLAACAMGEMQRRNFCRSLPPGPVRVACWSIEFMSEVACRGWCFWNFD